MILFTLRCAAEHEFEGWFRDNAAYDRQQARGLIACPECGGNEISKAPMAPSVRRSPSKQAPSPEQLRRALQEARRHIEKHCEDVGDRFAEEARRIHRGEAEERGIYGEASDAEANDLADEGIAFGRIPWIPSSDA